MSKTQTTKKVRTNDKYWKKIWKKNKIGEQNWKNHLVLEHKKIENVSVDGKTRQIRLLNYQSFTMKEQRPEEFKKNDLFLLPKSNDEFVIAKGSEHTYFDFGNINNPKKITEDEVYVEEYENRRVGLSVGKSESRALDLAYVVGLIKKCCDDDGLKLSMRLRHYVGEDEKFESYIGENKNEVEFSGLQYEADSVYESKDNIVIVEAKELTKNWNKNGYAVKQLYFPYRILYEKMKRLNLKKRITCLYMFYRFKEQNKNPIVEYKFINIEFPNPKYWKYKIKGSYECNIPLKSSS